MGHFNIIRDSVLMAVGIYIVVVMFIDSSDKYVNGKTLVL